MKMMMDVDGWMDGVTIALLFKGYNNYK